MDNCIFLQTRKLDVQSWQSMMFLTGSVLFLQKLLTKVTKVLQKVLCLKAFRRYPKSYSVQSKPTRSLSIGMKENKRQCFGEMILTTLR